MDRHMTCDLTQYLRQIALNADWTNLVCRIKAPGKSDQPPQTDKLDTKMRLIIERLFKSLPIPKLAGWGRCT